MSLPNFAPHLEFFDDIEDAANDMALDFPERLPTIGTGEEVLAERLVAKREPDSCVYIHRWNRSDPDDLHDHPWDNVSVVLTVGYWETVEEVISGNTNR